MDPSDGDETMYYILRRPCTDQRPTQLCDLPDFLLVNILSLLSLEEAVATSVLSKRWRPLWKHINGEFIFKDDESLGQLCYKSRREIHNESHRFVNRVNSMLTKHTAPYIESFIVCFELDNRFSTSLDYWVHFAMRKEVRKLVLDLLLTRTNIFQDSYSFPQHLLGICDSSTPAFRPKLPRLKFRCPQCFDTYPDKECPDCIDSPCPQCPDDFVYSKVLPPLDNSTVYHRLQHLEFDNVDLNDQVLDFFLTHCPCIRKLSVSRTTNLHHIRIFHNYHLTHLVIKNCLFFESLEIVMSSIESLIYQGHAVKLYVHDVPLLNEVCLNQTDLIIDDMWKHASEQLSSYLIQLETIMLDIRYHGQGACICQTSFAKWKTLELIVLADDFFSVIRLDTFIDMSPSLEALVLKLQYYPTKFKMIKCAEPRQHGCLKSVEIQGYHDNENADEHVMYLVEKAVGLWKITLDPSMRWQTHPSGAEKSIWEVREEVKAREHGQKLIEKMASSVRIECL